ncbi:PREDICTED: reverse mRNAase [Prunus dulcis]|uniref:PREDICTED: reverse mRNAase n=1 Tax=Prunus dulcis TaxID=3755 RepID=A0A5E4G2E5_PRUDU|nr:PREDICTED: reverse mRNAase [Prunus dulcis]
MACFRFPEGTCNQINSALASFWWGNNEENAGIHWKSWKKLCLAKKVGGLGFRDLSNFNLALLAKQSWRIILNPQAAWVKILKSIRCIPIGHSSRPDRLVWPWNSSGSYTVKSGYHCFHARQNTDIASHNHTSRIVSERVWKTIWKVETLPKIKLFIWRALYLDPSQPNLFFLKEKLQLIPSAQFAKVSKNRPDPRLVITHARDACSEYLAVVSKNDARVNLSPVHHVQRTRCPKPSPNYVKFNFASSWLPGTMKGSFDIVSQAAAALCALHLAKNRGCLKVILETDCKVLIDGITGNHGNNSWAILPLIDEIHVVVSNFEEVTWSWVPRSANRTSHAATSIGNRAMELQSWVDRPPLSLVGVLTSDGLPCPPHVASAV